MRTGVSEWPEDPSLRAYMRAQRGPIVISMIAGGLGALAVIGLLSWIGLDVGVLGAVVAGFLCASIAARSMERRSS